MTEDQIKHMVDRFLGWKLPSNFNPDAGISFKAAFNESTAYPMKHEPSGTNLFDASQTDAMVRYLIDGMPSAAATPPSGSAVAMRDGIAAIVNDNTMINDEGFVQNSELVADLILRNFPSLVSRPMRGGT